MYQTHFLFISCLLQTQLVFNWTYHVFWRGPCCSSFSVLYCPINVSTFPRSVLGYPLRVPHKNDIRFVVTSMSYLRYLCLLAYSGVQHILCCVFIFFVLCTLWIVIAPSVFFSSNNKTLNARLLARVITGYAITRNGAAAEIFCARLPSFWRLHLSIIRHNLSFCPLL
jgi:hypothetical protein